MNNTSEKPSGADDPAATSENDTPTGQHGKDSRPVEVGGRDGPEPTRYGDWEKAGRCIDF